MKVITPDWLLDSIELGKRLKEADYHPSCLHYLRGGEGGEGEREGGEEEDEREGGEEEDEREDVKSPTYNGEDNVTTEQGREGGSLIVTSGEVQNIRIPSQTKGRRGRGKRVIPTEVRGKPAVGSVSGSRPKSVPVTPETSIPVPFAQPLESRAPPTKPTLELQPQQGPPDPDDTKLSSVYVAEKIVVLTKGPDNPVDILPATEAQAGTQSEVPQASAASPVSPEETHVERGTLLEGVVMCFTDYQDCMDSETIAKWNQVSFVRLSVF